jgi:hypothetical protein
MVFSVNDEIFYDHTVTKQPIIFEIAFHQPMMFPFELQKNRLPTGKAALVQGLQA